MGSTDYTNLVAQTNTLRTSILTLATDPSIKKFFGPQMSNADVTLMTSAGTTLNPELNDPAQMYDEIKRLQDLFARMQSALSTGGASTQRGALPDGTMVTRNPDGSITDDAGNKYDENGNPL